MIAVIYSDQQKSESIGLYLVDILYISFHFIIYITVSVPDYQFQRDP